MYIYIYIYHNLSCGTNSYGASGVPDVFCHSWASQTLVLARPCTCKLVKHVQTDLQVLTDVLVHTQPLCKV